MNGATGKPQIPTSIRSAAAQTEGQRSISSWQMPSAQSLISWWYGALIASRGVFADVPVSRVLFLFRRWLSSSGGRATSLASLFQNTGAVLCVTESRLS